jgi:hypothetical protein
MSLPDAPQLVETQTPPWRVLPVIHVSCLVCHSHVQLALTCLGSLKRCSANPVSLLLHDDGSLTDDDVARLESELAPARVIRRKESDEQMAEHLKHRPVSAAFRQETCMGLKLFDSVFYNTDPIYIYVDTDIFFFRPFKDLFTLPDAQTHAVFMHDSIENTYSFRSWDLALCPRIPLPRQVNAGLCAMRREKYDPDFIEWFLSKRRHARNRHHGVPEQTAWAVLAMKVGGRKWDERDIAISRPGMQVQPRLIAAHFVGMYRYLLPGYIPQVRPLTDLPVAPGPTLAMRKCMPYHLAYHESKRIYERKLAKLRSRK